MTPAPIPADENERLAALRELLLLDTPPEERFDRLARFAAEQLDTPIALLTLVDGQRQWFKSRILPLRARSLSVLPGGLPCRC